MLHLEHSISFGEAGLSQQTACLQRLIKLDESLSLVARPKLVHLFYAHIPYSFDSWLRSECHSSYTRSSGEDWTASSSLTLYSFFSHSTIPRTWRLLTSPREHQHGPHTTSTSTTLESPHSPLPIAVSLCLHRKSTVEKLSATPDSTAADGRAAAAARAHWKTA